MVNRKLRISPADNTRMGDGGVPGIVIGRLCDEIQISVGKSMATMGHCERASDLKVDSYRFTSPVGSFPANQFGLYDISGNASQWCEYDDPLSKRIDRPRRGGSWAHSESWMLLCADSASSASGSSAAEQGQLGLGFRIILGAPAQEVASLIVDFGHPSCFI